MRTLPSLTALRVFEEVGKHLSFTKTADALHVTQGAVSRQVKQLEDYLGTPLLIRHHHRLELTNAGKRLLPQLEQAFNLMELAVQGLRNPNLRQTLRALVPPTYSTRWLVGHLADFHHRFPEIDLSIKDHKSDDSSFDCEIRFGRIAQTRCYSELLYLEEHLAVCSPELIDEEGSVDLDAHSFLHILHEGNRLKLWEDWLEAADLKGVDPQQGMEFSTLDQVINATVAGAGLAIIDRHMIERELDSGALVPFSQVVVTGPYGYWLDVASDSQGLAKVIRFSEWLREMTQKEKASFDSTGGR